MQKQKFRKVMAANRGEIAIRIFRACTELGIGTVAIYSEEDKLSLHRYKADEAYLIGKGKAPIDAYLGIDEIIALAIKADVDAIHPGYGFLAENAEFAEECRVNGITFIGPTSEMMRALGDKVAGRKAAIAAGVNVVPGTEDPIEKEEEALKFAKEYGYPIIIKASAGGGGRGMRVAHNKKELLEGLVAAASEAKASFGNAEVFLERYLANPKHIEVQVLGDNYGNLVHFFDRDCSVQRRHQKVVEFAPSLSLTQTQREELCTAALKIAGHVKYRNAGTIEFLVDAEGKHYFIEMNPRIQVEHTVTEMITGRNLVQNQILVACGHKLSDPEINIPSQRAIDMRGYAIQCRITTEDPANNFAPDFGTLTTYRSAAGCGVRLDAGNAFTGAKITPHYDSLLVKVSSWGLTFNEAANIMHRSLQEFRVRGVKTNIGFLENVVTHPVFLKGQCDTSFIDKHPELLHFREKKDRASKVLSFLGEVIVNGSPGITKPLKSADLIEARVPEIDTNRPRPAGSKDLFMQLGAEGLAKWILEQKKLLITDTTMRDAHQSNLATRVRSYDLLKIAEPTSYLGADLFSLECWGGATFDVSMRFLREDPWQRLHKLSELVPNILFQMLLRGSNAVGYTNYPDNVVRALRGGGRQFRRRHLPRLRLAQLDHRHEGGHGGGPEERQDLRGRHLLHRRHHRPQAGQVSAGILRQHGQGAGADGRPHPGHQGYGRSAQAAGRLQAGQGAQGEHRHPGPPPHPRHLLQRQRHAAQGQRGRGGYRRCGPVVPVRPDGPAQPERPGGNAGRERARSAGECRAACSSWPTTGRRCATTMPPSSPGSRSARPRSITTRSPAASTPTTSRRWPVSA